MVELMQRGLEPRVIQAEVVNPPVILVRSPSIAPDRDKLHSTRERETPLWPHIFARPSQTALET